MDELRFLAGPIVQRYLDKVENERQAQMKINEEVNPQKEEKRDTEMKDTEGEGQKGGNNDLEMEEVE